MAEKYHENIERANIDYEFGKLSNESQQKVAKTIIWKKVVHEYIERETNRFASSSIGGKTPSEENVEAFRYYLVDELAEVVDSMLDILFGTDEELKIRLFQKLISGYSVVVQDIKDEINDQHMEDWDEYEERLSRSKK